MVWFGSKEKEEGMDGTRGHGAPCARPATTPVVALFKSDLQICGTLCSLIMP